MNKESNLSVTDIGLNQMNAQPQAALVATILRTKDLAIALNVSKPTACRLLHSGKIPKIQISQKCIGAFQSDVSAYLQNQRT